MKNPEKLNFFEEMLIAINSAQSTDELLNFLIDRCIEITGALTGSIMLLNHETNILEIKVFRGLKKERVIQTRLKAGEGVTGHVVKTGTPLLINNVDEIEYYVRIRGDLKSELAVPLKWDKEIIGVISVDSNKRNAFTNEDLDILIVISNIAAQILLKANLIDDLKQQINNQTTLLKIAGILEESLILKDMFNRVMKVISTAIQIKRGMLLIVDKNNKLTTFAGYKLSPEAMNRGVYEIGEGITGQAFKHGKSIIIKDIRKSNEFLNKMKIRRGNLEYNSFFIIPLKYRQNTFGILSIEKPYLNNKNFSETKSFLTLIASLISTKIHTYEIVQKEKEDLLEKNRELKEKLLQQDSSTTFMGKNKKILEIHELVNLVSETDATIMITGETGTGKEVLARYIHNKSKRWEKSFIGINCAAIPENLLESELFGYKKGAFTGAVSDKKGKFVLANDGTLFLDEIGDLSIPLQSKILRVIQDKMVDPLGSEKSIKVDVRIISATNKNLKELISENKFREDLYYRLNVININIPSLSERKDDIPILINRFVSIYSKKYNKQIQGTTERFKKHLLKYPWPGNIRELENVIERAVILSKNNMLDITSIPEHITGTEFKTEDIFEKSILHEINLYREGEIFDKIIENVERTLIENTLTETNGNQSEASKILGLHRNTLLNKIKKFQL